MPVLPTQQQLQQAVAEPVRPAPTQQPPQSVRQYQPAVSAYGGREEPSLWLQEQHVQQQEQPLAHGGSCRGDSDLTFEHAGFF